jgi:hypothetical protein
MDEPLEVKMAEARFRKTEIDAYKQKLVQEALQENQGEGLVEEEVRAEIDKQDPVKILKLVDQEKERFVEAELQKRLTRAVPFLRSRLT